MLETIIGVTLGIATCVLVIGAILYALFSGDTKSKRSQPRSEFNPGIDDFGPFPDD